MFKTLFSRKYTKTVAVNDISLEIPDGQIVGYIGSNGAGKSTTIKMVCGILTPTSGHIYINGLEPYKKRKEIAKDIGVVFGKKTQLWWDIPVIETFKVLKEIYLISDEDYKERIEFLEEALDLHSYMNQPVRTLSLGQRMRADLAAAWLHNAKILFLDEPTIGLDRLSTKNVDLLILDDFGLAKMTAAETRDFLELIVDRNTIKSCIIISQLPISNWYDIFFDPTLAEAIMDRIQSNSYKIELKGPSKRGTLQNDIE